MPTSEREARPPRAAVPMSVLLAAGAAANAVSTPPEPQPADRRTAKAGRAPRSHPSGD
ncbi:hypothetical protein MHW47_30665 [Streptomyces sp. OfavH-34-F]|uniref:hypothetical protein n=1 Tax=unclassified Streptomyces TaxID=2593676 RepID=UPI001EF2691F|nr:hypothetical protein [Streptomyces sp. OfavH-34-F]MCG7528787.1 hypothetical protein [Streptomyces sp. OfavH-34-F]